MSIWFFKLRNGTRGTVQAADDDAAWESVIALTKQAPNMVRWVQDIPDEVAA